MCHGHVKGNLAASDAVWGNCWWLTSKRKHYKYIWLTECRDKVNTQQSGFNSCGSTESTLRQLAWKINPETTRYMTIRIPAYETHTWRESSGETLRLGDQTSWSTWHGYTVQRIAGLQQICKMFLHGWACARTRNRSITFCVADLNSLVDIESMFNIID